jgi:hypothetical protein
MRNSFLMAMVKTSHKFLEIVSSKWLLESARESNEIE